MAVRFSAPARRAIDRAMMSAEQRGHPLLAPAHLLLGLLDDPSAPVASALQSLGVDPATLRSATATALDAVAAGDDGGSSVDAAAEKLLQRAAELSGERRSPEVTDVDILAAAAESSGSAVAIVLAGAGVTAAALQKLGQVQRTPEAPGLRHLVTHVGNGYDSHRLEAGRPLILGGVRIPFDRGLVGHSDGDAIAHAVTDAVLGAAGAGDIGEMFSDTDPANRGRDSIEMLRAAVERVRGLGWQVQQVDVTLIAERPKIAPYRHEIRARLALALGCEPDSVSVKGKTNEGMGWVGRGEGIACLASATLTSMRGK